MPQTTMLGDASSQCTQVMPIAVRPQLGETVTVSNASAGDVVNFFTDISNGSVAAGTITLGSSQAFTVPVWLTSNSRSTISISGGLYGV